MPRSTHHTPRCGGWFRNLSRHSRAASRLLPHILQMFTTKERAQRFAERARTRDARIVRIAVVAAVLPGIPTSIVYAMAGLAGMRLTTFLILDFVGALIVTGLAAVLGYELGQNAVDVVLMVDRYAGIVSLTLISTTFLIPALRRLHRRGWRRKSRAANGPARPSANEHPNT